MKIYGYTIVDTNAWEDGTESCTKLFKDENTRDNNAYKAYKETLKYYDEEVDEEFSDILTKKTFREKFKKSYVLIQLHDTHWQIEPWEYELH